MSKIMPEHLARGAFVYVRQSTACQVVNNLEPATAVWPGRTSTQLSWDDVQVVDDDFGKSGGGTARPGFEKLLAAICEGRVGAVVSLEASRLARNGRDWHTLLEFCGLVGTLIVDEDAIVDPRSPNDRLLLGMKGTISELELHTIRSRLTAGLLAKAERGELALTLPIGFIRGPSDVVVKDPDLGVQERLGLVFELFLKFRTAAKVMRVLNDRGLDLPRRDRHGDLHWARATVSSVAAILKNPAYAGAFVYGRTRMRAVAREGAAQAKAPRPIEE